MPLEHFLCDLRLDFGLGMGQNMVLVLLALGISKSTDDVEGGLLAVSGIL